jgi:hypothetical protein
VSFFSQPAIEWVISKVNTLKYRTAASQMVTDLARMLKMSEPISDSRAPEPPPELAWQYTQGNMSHVSILGYLAN